MSDALSFYGPVTATWAQPEACTPAVVAAVSTVCGKAAGSATPLIWAQAQYLRLLRDLQTGKLLDQPADTRARYLNGAPTEVPVTITSPAPGATVSGATTVTGTTRPGATVEVAAGQPGSTTNATSVVSTVAGADGAFKATVPTASPQTVLTAATTAGAHASGWAQVAVTGP